MRKRSLSRAALCLLAPGSFGCIGQTGGNAVDLPVAAAGPASAISGLPLSCASAKVGVVGAMVSSVKEKVELLALLPAGSMSVTTTVWVPWPVGAV